jgi:hypothetical protein
MLIIFEIKCGLIKCYISRKFRPKNVYKLYNGPVFICIQIYNNSSKRDGSERPGCGLTTDELRSDLRQVQEIFLFSTASRPVLVRTQCPVQCVLGSILPGVNGPGRETGMFLPSSAEVKRVC